MANDLRENYMVLDKKNNMSHQENEQESPYLKTTQLC